MPAIRRPRSDGMEAVFEAARGAAAPISIHATAPGLADAIVETILAHGPTDNMRHVDAGAIDVPLAALRALLCLMMQAQRRQVEMTCCACGHALTGMACWNAASHLDGCLFVRFARIVNLTEGAGAAPAAADVPVVVATVVPSQAGEDE